MARASAAESSLRLSSLITSSTVPGRALETSAIGAPVSVPVGAPLGVPSGCGALSVARVMPLPVHEPLIADFSALRRFKRVVIFGGSFDPLTRAHLQVPELVRQRTGADAILFVPASKNPLKTTGPRASNDDRLTMLRRALSTRPHCLVSNYELDQAGPSYTVDMLHQIRQAVGDSIELVLFVGSDCVHDFPKWKNIEDIFRLAKVVPLTRNEGKKAVVDELRARGQLAPHLIDELDRAFIEADVPAVSSTLVREALGGGRMPTDMVSNEVAEYIAEHGLYGYKAPT